MSTLNRWFKGTGWYVTIFHSDSARIKQIVKPKWTFKCAILVCQMCLHIRLTLLNVQLPSSSSWPGECCVSFSAFRAVFTEILPSITSMCPVRCSSGPAGWSTDGVYVLVISSVTWDQWEDDKWRRWKGRTCHKLPEQEIFFSCRYPACQLWSVKGKDVLHPLWCLSCWGAFYKYVAMLTNLYIYPKTQLHF